MLLDFLFPSCWEVKVALSSALLVIAAFLTWGKSYAHSAISRRSDHLRPRRGNKTTTTENTEIVVEREDYQEKLLSEEDSPYSSFLVKLELLAGKNLSGSNLDGTSDAYAIITCGSQTKYSSMRPCSRDPLWGEEFNFFVDKLPIQISVAIHDWDIVRQPTILGSLVIPIEREGQIGANWYTLDSKTSGVCLHISSFKLPSAFCRTFSSFIIADARRRRSSEICCKPGPLQTIFNLPLDEVLSHSYSCALERSFLYHGRMYVSTWNICFHSNVFSKQMKVVIPFGDIYEIKRSQHACINPAITIILQTGSGGHGVPPLVGPSGRVRYKFASFWNRNHSFRALHHTLKIYQAWVEAEKKEKVQSALGVCRNSIPIHEKSRVHGSIAKTTSQAKVNEKILVCSIKDNFPCTAEQFFTLLLSDDSKFFKEFLLARNDTNICLGNWHPSDEYEGIVREVTFRSLCQSPLCPPDTAVTEWQHALQSNDNASLVFETVQKAHDVPFGSYFEIHSRWILSTNIGNSCSIDINIGINFSRWCILQSRIRSGAINQQKKEVERFLETARAYLLVSKYSIKGMDEESKHPSSTAQHPEELMQLIRNRQ